VYLHRRLIRKEFFGMKDGSPHQNTLCIFVSSTVKILGLKQGSAAECDKSKEMTHSHGGIKRDSMPTLLQNGSTRKENEMT
jgi:hypothetical protein